jgi:tetrapyrrole methylase family protein/MazG family protein
MKLTGVEQAVAKVRALRAEGGCPWDRAQTHETLRPYLLEETYEVLEALDQAPSPARQANLREELGDLLLQVLLHAQIAEEKGEFSFDELAGDLAAKLERRHPHVFGGAKLGTAEEVVSQWEKTKAKEKPKLSALDGVTPALPALQQSLKVIEKVSKVGFQWENLEGPLEKLEEELQEFLAEVKVLGPAGSVTRASTQELAPQIRSAIESELGDLLFALGNVAYFLHVNPEDALRTMLARFSKRFRHVEMRAKESGRDLKEMSLAEMDVFWAEAKRL